MEQIKFRWLSTNGEWVYWYYAYTSIFSNRNDYYKNIIITKNDYKEIDEWTQSMFTWLYDKNWKEIFDWDLLKHQQYIYKVEYSISQATFQAIDTNNKERSFPLFCITIDREKPEIIWNIYENLITNK